ncbi:hypothetical protein PPYR_05086 [Photinus pyralis]|uniref:LisH domain-containing protein n=1 Tax=Photinus pyralis TaxID=7054 RepID=A0A5N4B0G4_PHOPY|nr:uncharacterized protein LOC116164976 [Photinus pyralis]KAB0802900.1 hypothetical protein PPYR_05086 [Photinus pyralis]
MSIKVSFNITREETVGVLKTIFLFLNGLNLTQTVKILQDECAEKGYGEVKSETQQAPNFPIAKISFSDNKDTSKLESHQSKNFQLASSTAVEAKEDVVLYCLDPSKQSSQIYDGMEKHQERKFNRILKKSAKGLRSFSGNYLKREIPTQTIPFHKSLSEPSLHIRFQESCQNDDLQLKNYRRLKQSFQKLESEHKKLMGVTTELTSALQTYIKGQTENLNATLNKCKIIYPELFYSGLAGSRFIKSEDSSEPLHPLIVNPCDMANDSRNVEGTMGLITILPALICNSTNDWNDSNCEEGMPDESTKTRIAAEDEPVGKDTSQFEKFCQHNLATRLSTELIYKSNVPASIENYFELDYKKLKGDLIMGTDELKIALLQGLRMRITGSTNEIRTQVIQSYVVNDILELNRSSSTGKFLIEVYFPSDTESFHLSQEELSKLMNTIASLTVGRDYMCQSEAHLLYLLSIILKHGNSTINDSTRDMLIATAQKLSLRYKQRVYMINSGFVEYLLTFLMNLHSKISHYCMENSTALLMNLCLHKDARDRLHPYAKDVISLLVNLLDIRYSFCMPYINGTMYSLLSDPVINEEAHRISLSKLLDYHISNSDEQTKTELQHILQLHLKGVPKQGCDCNSTIESNAEVDILEHDLENSTSTEIALAVITKYRLSESMEHLQKPMTPFTKSVTEKLTATEPDTIEDDTKFADVSYCEETKQHYYTPTRNAIFEPRQMKKLHRAPPSFTQAFQKPQNGLMGKFCRYCPRSFPKTKHFIRKESTSPQTTAISDIGHVRMCYRDQYTTPSHLYRENKYTCDCYNAIRRTINLPNQEDNDNYNQDETDNHYNTQLYHCHRCQKSDNLQNSVTQLEKCGRSCSCMDTDEMRAGNTVEFSLKELSSTIHLGNHACPCQDDCHCYDFVFQSRPKVLRTPP